MITVGERIRRTRERRNYTVIDLANSLGTTQKVIYNIETDRTEADYKLLIGLSEKLKVSIDYLLKGEYAE
jgi:transcriptional regulator with XRE-family HTH domain